MKNKILSLSAITFITIAAVVVVLYQQKTIRDLKQFFGMSKVFDIGTFEKMRMENILLKEGFFHSYDFVDIPLDYSMMVQNFDGDSVTLNELFAGKNHLVIFMSSIGYCSCVPTNIKIINDEKEQTDIIVCIDGLSKKEFQSFVSQNGIKDRAYLLPPDSYNGFAINPVIYFVVDKNLKANFFYAPSITFPELTKDYLYIVKRKMQF